MKGFALLIVLWAAVLLALLATGITAAGRSDVQLAGNVRRAASAQAAADGGVFAAVFHAGAPPAEAWRADGQDHRTAIGNATVTVRIDDANRLVNPNFAPPPLLAALLAGCGAPPDDAAAVAQSILEWHVPGRRPDVEERYRRAGLAASPTGQPFEAVDDLRLVLGMVPAWFDCLAPHLSVYTAGPVNYVRADPVVRTALRAANGGAEPPPPSGETTVLDVFAEAAAPDGSRARRHAVVALAAIGTVPPFRVLAWDAAR